MAMDVELRNALGALTAQVQELTKQSKTLDTTLAGALDKGSKAAGGLADSAKKTRNELSTVEQVTKRIGSAWTSQLVSMAAGTVGITAAVTAISSYVNKAYEEAERRGKAVRDFAVNSRPPAPPAILPQLRSAIRGSALGVQPDDQASALRNYLIAGGPANEREVGRLGQVISGGDLLGFDPQSLGTQYAQLRKLGVTQPEDVIYALGRENKLGEIDKLPAGRARALGASNAGAWSDALGQARRLAPDEYRAWEERTKAAKQANEALAEGLRNDERQARIRTLQALAGPSVTSVADRSSQGGLLGSNIVDPVRLPRFGITVNGGTIQRQFPGMTPSQIEDFIDRNIAAGGVPTALDGLLPSSPDPPAPSAVAPAALPAAPPPAAPPHWSQTVPRAQPPSAQRSPVVEVRLVGDARPMPLNAGE